jgi:hypothetical protein
LYALENNDWSEKTQNITKTITEEDQEDHFWVALWLKAW